MFHTLPKSGGILDQDFYLVQGMKAVLEARAAKHERDKQKTQPKTRAR